jgi:hypothetical protein
MIAYPVIVKILRAMQSIPPLYFICTIFQNEHITQKIIARKASAMQPSRLIHWISLMFLARGPFCSCVISASTRIICLSFEKQLGSMSFS